MKVTLGAQNWLYPMPTTLVGAHVNEKPNYVTIANTGIMSSGCIALNINKARYTNTGIKENGTFSVNIPSVELVSETDYCGLVSGENVDKAELFETFYGKLGTAPMIKACPINMECKLIRTIDFPKHHGFIGEIIETYCDENCLTDGVVDLSKTRPILLVRHDKGYWKLGERFADAWSVGKKLKKP